MKKLLTAFLTATAFATGIAYAAVNAPSNVAADGVSATTIRVTWTDNSNNEDGFNIFRSNQQGSGFVLVGTVGANVTSFEDACCTAANTVRHYRVTAFKKSVYIPEEGSDISNGDSGTTVSSAPVNTNPVANDDTATGVAPTSLSGNVLTNDTDADSDPLTVQQPNANIAANGAWSMQFNSQGVFTFPYTALDGRGGSDSAVLTVTIDPPPPTNQNPVATDNSYTVQRDQQLTGNVMTDSPADSDPDSDPLSVDPITSGPFILSANGSFTFTPPSSGTSFAIDYTLRDNRGGSDIGRVNIAITEPPPPPNVAPVAVDDFNSGQVNVAVTGNVLTNDTDADGDILTVTQPNASGINSNGTYSITKTSTGIFNHAYTVQDGNGGTDTGNLQLTINPAPPTGGLVAFPGAEGYGRFSKGGRGGAVIQVTNLNDSGAGSLRQCAEVMSGPRTCVFRIAGTLSVNDAITINNPFLTIAGETAPGQGFLIRAGSANTRQTMRIFTHDITIRHLKIRAGGPNRTAVNGDNGDNILVGGVGSLETTDNISNIMLDHLSLAWGTDENIDISPWSDAITIQNTIVAEGLKPHSKGPGFRGCGVSMIDSAIANNTIRNPNNTCGKEIPGSVRGGGSKSGQTEFRNNVVHGGTQGYFDFFNGRGEGWTNVAGNVFSRSPETPSGNTAVYSVDVREVTATPLLNDNGCPGGANCSAWKPAGTTDPQHICVQDNAEINDVSGSRPAPIHNVLDPRDATATNVTGGTPVLHSTDCVNDPASDPAEGRELTGAVRDADANATTARSQVLADVGAFYWNRDSADAQVISNILSAGGSVPTCVTAGTLCGGLPYPTIAGGTPYPDADADGMDDNYETANGVTNPNGDVDGDGYTNLEEFLHSLATR